MLVNDETGRIADLGLPTLRDPSVSSSTSANTEVEFIWVSPDELFPNSWNPNEMDAEQFNKALRSIDDFGFIDPITARPGIAGYEIIDGENRWRAARQRRLTNVPVVVIEVDDAAARQLTVILNEVRGQANPEKLAALLRDLSITETKETLLARLPYSMEALDRLTGLPTMGWEKLDSSRLQMPVGRPAKWTERVYRMPLDAAETIDRAVARWREQEGDQTPEWRILELICADWLAGA